ncbi:uncharacterized protein MONOS_1040 [Monocercomonoides exilis]|uniref:uncharacterized protein n=1 Tax=Monocercomonoides exilis TaxID=2049356 RepID=UPI003559EE8C|nr:hypothetical protein MONOS_1040 [Monocercomonoides exilis]|eukprot:MONOS_1040.1-p1 / transcript=MONOS_1040.1 / gene=MONOS_1040 / organism=Monocercomonoides_exilis_PA203 / gene_product=unspecified product / transcript_product=unspecified product / location=Mono_scaffold00017:196075-197429(-) / protein_length=393 / sequence_SO=supercontig / SO=protein_coding / is_pseudo=false
MITRDSKTKITNEEASLQLHQSELSAFSYLCEAFRAQTSTQTFNQTVTLEMIKDAFNIPTSVAAREVEWAAGNEELINLSKKVEKPILDVVYSSATAIDFVEKDPESVHPFRLLPAISLGIAPPQFSLASNSRIKSYEKEKETKTIRLSASRRKRSLQLSPLRHSNTQGPSTPKLQTSTLSSLPRTRKSRSHTPSASMSSVPQSSKANSSASSSSSSSSLSSLPSADMLKNFTLPSLEVVQKVPFEKLQRLKDVCLFQIAQMQKEFQSWGVTVNTAILRKLKVAQSKDKERVQKEKEKIEKSSTKENEKESEVVTRKGKRKTKSSKTQSKKEENKNKVEANNDETEVSKEEQEEESSDESVNDDDITEENKNRSHEGDTTDDELFSGEFKKR